MADKPNAAQVMNDAAEHRGCTVMHELAPLVSLEDRSQFFNSLKQQAQNGVTVESGASHDGKSISFSINDPLMKEKRGRDLYYEDKSIDGHSSSGTCSEYVQDAPLKNSAHAPLAQITANISAHFDRTNNGGKTNIDGEFLAKQLNGLSTSEKAMVFDQLKKHGVNAEYSAKGDQIEFKISSSNSAIRWYEDKVNLSKGTHSQFYSAEK